MSPSSSQTALFRHRPYLFYLSAYSVSMLGTGMQFIANSWLVLQLTNSSYSVALVLAATALPGILLSPIIGIYVDRIDRKFLGVAADIFRAVALLAVPILWWQGALHSWHVYGMSFFVALGDEIYAPAAMGLIREVVPPDLLLPANSLISMASQAGILAGEAIGGILVAQTSPIWVMVINAVSFVFSAFCIWRMRREYRPPGVSSTGNKGYKKLWMEMKEGFHYIRLLPAVIFCYVMMMLIRATLYAINVLLPPFSRDVLKIGAQGFGYIDACFALGAIAGNLFLPWCTRVWGNHAVMVSGMAGIGACLFLFAAVHGLPIAMLVYFLLGIAFQVGVLYFTSAQKEIAVQYQGRVHSNFNTLFAASSLAVYLLMGHLADAISMRRLYIFQGSIMLTGALAAAMWLYRRPPVAAGKQQEKYAA